MLHPPAHAPRPGPGRTRPRVRRILAAMLAASLLAVACGGDDSVAQPTDTAAPTPTGQMDMGAQPASGEDAPRFPAVFGYYQGEEILFIHSETSNPDVGNMLTQMMGGSPVLVVDSLAQIRQELLGTVYVFTNGIEPDDTPAGPLGFQPDVFDSAPGDPGYTPLRRIMLVTWADGEQATLLTSEQEILDAESAGRVTLEERGAVVVMPFLTWPGGQR